MGGGMGGGMRGGGMRGRGGPGMGQRSSPTKRLRERLEESSTVAFLLDHKKPLALTKLQQDSLKAYRKDVERLQKPLFASLEQVLSEATTRGLRRGDGPPPGAIDDGANGGRPGALDDLLPDSARTLLRRLEDVQQAYGERARAQLDATQRARADSIQSARLEAQRAEAMKRREAVERRRGG